MALTKIGDNGTWSKCGQGAYPESGWRKDWIVRLNRWAADGKARKTSVYRLVDSAAAMDRRGSIRSLDVRWAPHAIDIYWCVVYLELSGICGRSRDI